MTGSGVAVLSSRPWRRHLRRRPREGDGVLAGADAQRPVIERERDRAMARCAYSTAFSSFVQDSPDTRLIGAFARDGLARPKAAAAMVAAYFPKVRNFPRRQGQRLKTDSPESDVGSTAMPILTLHVFQAPAEAKATTDA